MTSNALLTAVDLQTSTPESLGKSPTATSFGSIISPIAPDADTASGILGELIKLNMKAFADELAVSNTFRESVESYVSSQGTNGLDIAIKALKGRELDEMAWELVDVLGTMNHPPSLEQRFKFLARVLYDNSDGDRAAAATAVGDLKHDLSRKVLSGQLDRELNGFVKTVILGKLEALEHHGTTIARNRREAVGKVAKRPRLGKG